MHNHRLRHVRNLHLHDMLLSVSTESLCSIFNCKVFSWYSVHLSDIPLAIFVVFCNNTGRSFVLLQLNAGARRGRRMVREAGATLSKSRLKRAAEWLQIRLPRVERMKLISM